MPRRRVSSEIKRMKGTMRPDRDYEGPEFKRIRDADPPPWLKGAEALRYWRQSVDILGSAGVLTVADLETLGHLCAVHAKLVKEGVSGPLLTQYRLLANDFGLSPSARLKVAPPKRDEADKNPFAEVLAS